MAHTDNEDKYSDAEPNTDLHEHRPGYKKDMRMAVQIKQFIPIDENHPVVKELLEMDYELEQCLEAAECFPDDATQALEYLMDTGGKGKLFASSIQTCGHEIFHDHSDIKPAEISVDIVADTKQDGLQSITSFSKPIMDRYVLMEIHFTVTCHCYNSFNCCISI